jgi:putative flippase GtrA
MKALIKKHESKIRFALVGGINTAIDFGILFLLTSFGLNKFVANFISTSVAFIFSFFANRSFTFKSTGSIKKQVLPFLLVTLSGLWLLQPALIWLVSLPLQELNETVSLLIAKLVATIGSLVWNYVLYSRFVFIERNRPEDE